jgi:hypothetical protein
MKPGGAPPVRLGKLMRTTGTSRLYAATAVASIAGLALVLTGCGSGGKSTTTTSASELQTWAGSFCTAVGTYKTSVAATRATLHVRTLSRPALQVAVQDLSAATRQLTDDLDQLGPAPLPDSAKAKKIIADLGAQLKGDGDKTRGVVTNASSTGDVRQAASNISDALTADTDAASHAAKELRKLDSEEAFGSAGSCSSLVG